MIRKISDKEALYLELIKCYQSAYPSKSKQNVQGDVTEIWRSMKKEKNYAALAAEKLAELKRIGQKKKGNLISYWSNLPQKRLDSKESRDSCGDDNSSDKENLTKQPSCSHSPSTSQLLREKSSDEGLNSKSKPTKAIAQNKLENEIFILMSDLLSLQTKKSLNYLTDDEFDLLKKKLEVFELKEKNLKTLQYNQQRQLKFRQKRKKEMNSLFEENPELRAEIPSFREKRGRPRLEEDQPELMKTITDIAMYGSAAEERRRNESIRSIKTLEQMVAELKNRGFNISRNGLYIRILPKRSGTVEGRRHVVTVPVKLMRASNDKHVNHIDGKFCAATIHNLEEIASLLGPKQVFFLSQDDKARVPIGLSAANKQAPLVMHMEYQISLPDHNWVIAPQHKLVPSVYAAIVIKENQLGDPKAVTYSGPTFIAVRSGKHSSSTSHSHAKDLDILLNLDQFDSVARTFPGGPTKPIFIFSVDGGPDENPRYEKVIRTGIHHFLEHDLDALFIATNAPGKSVFNRVERRMAPLSWELAGLILPHDKYGSHLDESCNTIDDDLERKNFQHAGETLAEIWSNMTIYDHPVCASYITPESSEVPEDSLRTKDISWRAKHVRESQYFTQIVKCNDLSCCNPTRSDYLRIVPKRFLPPPIPLIQSERGLATPDFPLLNSDTNVYKFPSLFVNLNLSSDMLPMNARSMKTIPYDLYCPSVQSVLMRRICNKCSVYHSSIVRAAVHQRACGKEENERSSVFVPKIRPLRAAAKRAREVLALMSKNESWEWVDEDLIEYDSSELEARQLTKTDDNIPVISVDKYMSVPWEDA